MTTLVPSPPRLNPYVGPRPFERGQRLYGRDREVARLRDLLIAERIVLLYSPSGAGKTSLIRAGLVPELEQEGFWVRPEIRVGAELAPVDCVQPANRYRLSTLLCLEKDLPAQARRDPAELAGMGLADYLDQLDGECDDVLIFDQFEELLVDPTDQDAKTAFLTELGIALRNRRHWAIFAIREDFVAGLDPYLRLLPTRLRVTFRLDLLDEAAARSAIQGPARDVGVEFSDAAAAKLVDNLRRVHVWRPEGSVEILGPYVEPVQLQVVCERLWERSRPDDLCITEADVQEVGDVDSALAAYYAERVRAVAAETGADERAIRAWFDHTLITEQGIRAQALSGPVDGDERVLWLLENAHLIRVETRGGARWFELAHDRLIRPVRSSNAEWFRANLQLFQRQAPLWQREFQPDHLLLAGDALAEAERWVNAHPGELAPLERRFLAASHAHQRRTRGRRLRIMASIVIAVLMVAGTGYAATVRSYSLAYQAMALLGDDPARAMELALEAVRWPPRTPQAQTALTNALAASHVRAILSLGRDSPAVMRADVSPNGQLVATVSDGIARTWNATTGDLMESFGAQVSMAQFSPDGSQVVTASGDRTARVWDVATGREQLLLRGHTDTVLSAQWSPDRSRIATTSLDGTVRLWDVATGREQLLLRGRTSGVATAQWSPGGSRIATIEDHTVRVWDAQTGEELAGTAGLGAGSVAVLPGGELRAAAGADGTGCLWRWPADQPQAALAGEVRALSPNGRWILTVVGDLPLVWDTCNGGSTQLRGHNAPADTARFSLDSAYVIGGSRDGTVRIWEAATGAMLVELLGHHDIVYDVAFSPAQPDPLRLTVVTASADGTARVWTPQIGQTLNVDPAPLSSASFSADGTLMAGVGADGVARVWRVETGERLAELRAPAPHPLLSAAFSPDERKLVTGGADGIARVWEWTAPEEPVAASPRVDGQIGAVAFAPRGALVLIAGAGRTAYLWDSASPPSLRPLSGHDDYVTDAAFSPDGTRVVTASLDGIARVWDTGTGAPLQILRGHAEPVYSAAFSPDGRLIVTTSGDRTAWIWDAATGGHVRSLTGHRSPLRDAAFSPDGRYVVTGATDGMIRIWHTETGRQLAPLRTPGGSVTSARFSPAGRLLVTTSQNGNGIARIYDCEVCASLSDLRMLANDRLRYVRQRGPDPQP